MFIMWSLELRKLRDCWLMDTGLLFLVSVWIGEKDFWFCCWEAYWMNMLGEVPGFCLVYSAEEIFSPDLNWELSL